MSDIFWITNYCDPHNRHEKMNREIYGVMLKYIDHPHEMKSMQNKLWELHVEGYNVKHLLNVICYRKWLEKYLLT